MTVGELIKILSALDSQAELRVWSQVREGDEDRPLLYVVVDDVEVPILY